MGNFHFTIPGSYGNKKFSLGDFQLKLDPRLGLKPPAKVLSAPGPLGKKPSWFGITPLSIGNTKRHLSNATLGSGRNSLWKIMNELPSVLLPNQYNLNKSAVVFGPVSSDMILPILLSEKMEKQAIEMNKALLLSQVNPKNKISFWFMYENDGDPPFNFGTGSDQGPTAKLSLFVTFDKEPKGFSLTKIGVTLINMYTPQGYLDGQASNPSSTYRTKDGPFAGITSLDFEVSAYKSNKIQVKILGSLGVDSSEWGKLVQDFIHKQISNSPVFPWPKGKLKLFAEIGGKVKFVPLKTIFGYSEFMGIKYHGKMEFDAKIITGTHRTETTLGTRIVLTQIVSKTSLGEVRVEYSAGVFVRGFFRYNDGRRKMISGFEGGTELSLMFKIGRLGIGLAGTMTSSQDPALQTNNSAGSSPVINKFPVGFRGGPAGHHGVGKAFLSWSF